MFEIILETNYQNRFQVSIDLFPEKPHIELSFFEVLDKRRQYGLSDSPSPTAEVICPDIHIKSTEEVFRRFAKMVNCNGDIIVTQNELSILLHQKDIEGIVNDDKTAFNDLYLANYEPKSSRQQNQILFLESLSVLRS